MSETNLVKDSLASLIRTDDPGTGDIYSGLDRFGWIKDCRWCNTDAEEDAVRLQYGYDRASNRLWRQEDVARSQSKNFEELYTYDGLHRLKTMQRGLLNGRHKAISSQTYGQCWNLDATENWTGMKQAEGRSAWTLADVRRFAFRELKNSDNNDETREHTTLLFRRDIGCAQEALDYARQVVEAGVGNERVLKCCRDIFKEFKQDEKTMKSCRVRRDAPF